MRLSLLLAVLFAALATASPDANALRSTDIESHTDPDFIGYKPSKVLIVVLGMSFEARQEVEKRLASDLARYGVESATERQLFPPTRKWEPEQKVEILQRNGFDSTIIVVAGANSSSVITYAQQTYGQANTYGQVNRNGTFNGTTSGTTTTYNLTLVKSSAEFSAVLVENGSGKTIWYGDILTKAGGTLFVGEARDAKASAKAVVGGLEDDGHLVKKKRR